MFLFEFLATWSIISPAIASQVSFVFEWAFRLVLREKPSNVTSSASVLCSKACVSNDLS